jgi:hypothetical protein
MVQEYIGARRRPRGAASPLRMGIDRVGNQHGQGSHRASAKCKHAGIADLTFWKGLSEVAP